MGHHYENNLHGYLPRLSFYATYCWPSLFRSLYSYPEVNRIQSCFEIEASSLLTYLKQSEKNQPIEKLLFATPLAHDRDSNFHHTIEQFEKGTPAEQIRIVALELFQLSKIFHYEIPDEQVKIPEITEPNFTDDPQMNKK